MCRQLTMRAMTAEVKSRADVCQVAFAAAVRLREHNSVTSLKRGKVRAATRLGSRDAEARRLARGNRSLIFGHTFLGLSATS